MIKISAVLDDLTTMNVDAIVLPANPRLTAGGGASAAIHRAAGAGLEKECLSIGPIPVGEAVLTNGYLLPAKYVVQAVGPIHGNQSEIESARLLEAAYIRSLEVADSAGCSSIAFPAISTGIYGYPFVDASKIAIESARSFEAKKLKNIFFVFLDRERLVEFQGLLKNLS